MAWSDENQPQEAVRFLHWSRQRLTVNWLRVSTGVGGGCYSGIEMMGKRSQIRCIS
jgi:hypothetical protein